MMRRRALLVLLLLPALAGCMVKYGQTEARLAPLGSWTWDYPAPYSHQVIATNAAVAVP